MANDSYSCFDNDNKMQYQYSNNQQREVQKLKTHDPIFYHTLSGVNPFKYWNNLLERMINGCYGYRNIIYFENGLLLV